jgi:hypothetical protein
MHARRTRVHLLLQYPLVSRQIGRFNKQVYILLGSKLSEFLSVTQSPLKLHNPPCICSFHIHLCRAEHHLYHWATLFLRGLEAFVESPDSWRRIALHGIEKILLVLISLGCWDGWNFPSRHLWLPWPGLFFGASSQWIWDLVASVRWCTLHQRHNWLVAHLGCANLEGHNWFVKDCWRCATGKRIHPNTGTSGNGNKRQTRGMHCLVKGETTVSTDISHLILVSCF